MFYYKADSLLLRYTVLKYKFVSKFVCVQDMLKKKLTVKETVPWIFKSNRWHFYGQNNIGSEILKSVIYQMLKCFKRITYFIPR